MPVTCTEEGRALTVWVAGEVDHHAARQLMTELGQRVDTAVPKSLILDLSGVTFMDSSGIALVLRTWRRMRELDGTMHVVNVPSQAFKVLQAAHIDRLIPTCSSAEATKGV